MYSIEMTRLQHESLAQMQMGNLGHVDCRAAISSSVDLLCFLPFIDTSDIVRTNDAERAVQVLILHPMLEVDNY